MGYLMCDKSGKNVHWSKTVSSTNIVGKTGPIHAKKKTRLLHHILKQIKNKDLHARPETMKLPEKM